MRRILFIGLFCLFIILVPVSYAIVSNYEYSQGYANGNITGNKDGYIKGYTAGQSDGYVNGYHSGYQTGSGDGFISGHASGFSDGKDVGGVAYVYKNCSYYYVDPSNYWLCKKIP